MKDEIDGRARIEDYHQQKTPRDVGDVNRLFLALVKKAGEIVFADQLGELVVGAVIGGRQRRERGRIETGRITDRCDELTRAVDQERAERFGLAKEAAQRFSYRGEIVLGERPVGRAGGHLPPFTASTRGA